MAGKSSDHTKDKDKNIFEILDVRGTASKGAFTDFQNYIKDISKAPVAKQAAIGGISGWVVGYLSMKVGKIVATAVGGSLIIIQLAAHKGYIKIDWRKVNKELENQTNKLTKEVESRLEPGFKKQVVQFVRENTVLAVSFTGGVLLGMAYC